MRVNHFSFFRSLQKWAGAAVGLCGVVLFAVEARAVTLTLYTNSIVIPTRRTFQMPLTGFDFDGQPLRFTATVSNPKALSAAIAPPSNPSLVMNVSGVDSNNNPFTGNIALQLFQDLTPLTTARIIDLVNSNFYNGLLFQRVVSNFVAQAGGSTTDPGFESGVTLDDDYAPTLTYNGFGQLGMANQGADNHNSNDSQFFITALNLSLGNPDVTNQPPESLSFVNGIFGQLTSGFDTFTDIIYTPVGLSESGEDSSPLSNVVINSAVIITNSQDGVLRLTASSTFTGAVTVVISATNAEHEVATQTLQVTIITDTTIYAPYVSPSPPSVTLTQNTATAFIIAPTNINGFAVSRFLGFADSFGFPTNLSVSVVPNTGLTWFSPDVTVTGEVDLVLGLTIDFQNFQTYPFSLTFLPWSASPTMMLTSLKGKLQDGSKTNKDTISVSGKFTFIGESDHMFASNDVLALTLGNPTTPLMLKITPDLPGWKFRDGSLNVKATVASGLSSNIGVSASLNSKNGTFKISAKNFNFPAAISNQQVEIGIAMGNDYTTNVQTWVEKKNGVFVSPAP